MNVAISMTRIATIPIDISKKAANTGAKIIEDEPAKDNMPLARA